MIKTLFAYAVILPLKLNVMKKAGNILILFIGIAGIHVSSVQAQSYARSKGNWSISLDAQASDVSPIKRDASGPTDGYLYGAGLHTTLWDKLRTGITFQNGAMRYTDSLSDQNDVYYSTQRIAVPLMLELPITGLRMSKKARYGQCRYFYFDVAIGPEFGYVIGNKNTQVVSRVETSVKTGLMLYIQKSGSDYHKMRFDGKVFVGYARGLTPFGSDNSGKKYRDYIGVSYIMTFYKTYMWARM